MSRHVLRVDDEIPGSAYGVTFHTTHASNSDVGFAHFIQYEETSKQVSGP